MPRGAPDYSNVRAGGPFHRVDDMGELATRLGSPVNFDRRGLVYFIDDFESGVANWAELLSGDGRSFCASSQHSRNGAFSLSIVPGITPPYKHNIIRKLAYPPTERLGFEIAFTVSSETNFVFFYVYIYDGTELHQVGVRYTHSTGQLLYHNHAGGWGLLASDVELIADDTLFHVLKFVVSIEDDEYVRIMLDGDSWNDLEYPLDVDEDPTRPSIEIRLWVYATDNSQPAHYFDSLILTQNEPA